MANEIKPNERIATPANIVTIIRILLVPAFVAALLSPWPEWLGLTGFTDQWKSVAAAFVFIIISCTDWLDGYLARSRNEVTDFGKFVDPLADKILVFAALLALIELDVLPSWPVLIILAREFIVSGVRMIAASHGEVIAASWYGKAKTVTQIIAIVLFLLKDSFIFPGLNTASPNPLYFLAWFVMVIALILTIVSMLDYLSKARHLISPRFTPKESKSVKNKHKQSTQNNEIASSSAISLHPTVEVPSIESLNSALTDKAQACIELALSRHATISCAESLTGGMISAALTRVSGSSAVVRGGVVSYVNDIKHQVLDVDENILNTRGAVDKTVACEMADGVRSLCGTTFAVSVTGIAGPTGAEEGKPVGTVWMGLASADSVTARLFHFGGNREQVRLQTALSALDALINCMSE